jgi:hypothetical protein
MNTMRFGLFDRIIAKFHKRTVAKKFKGKEPAC